MEMWWSVVSPLGYWPGAEWLEERGVLIDHATIQRRGIQDCPRLEEVLHRRQRPVGAVGAWRRRRVSSTAPGSILWSRSMAA